MLLRCPVCRFPFLKVKDGQIIVALLQKVLERTQGRMTCPGRNTTPALEHHCRNGNHPELQESPEFGTMILREPQSPKKQP